MYYKTELRENYKLNDYRIILYDQDDNELGFVSGDDHTAATNSYFKLEMLLVKDKEMRRKGRMGVGSLLLQKFEALALAMGATYIKGTFSLHEYYNSTEDWEQALTKFYKKHGYSIDRHSISKKIS
jgi:GNAT superfamily N-acetyltransferase